MDQNPTPTMTAPRGVIYLASGGRSYLGELMTSLESLRKYEPDLPVTVFSPFVPPRSAKCQHIDFRTKEHPLKEKVLVLKESPYEQTLFLDTDTNILNKVSPIFDFLNENDFAVGNMFEADWSVRPPKLISLVKPNEYNTGVLLYNKSAATMRFLKAWEDAIMPQDPLQMWAGFNCDQQYFNRIVEAGAPEQCGMKFTQFPNTIYNCRGIMVPELKRLGSWNQTRILHHRTRRMKMRKAMMSFTDWTTAREVAIKVIDRIQEKIPRKKPQAASGK